MKLLERLYAAPGLAVHGLLSGLAHLYDGDLRFDSPRVYANFVSSIDGVVALPSVDASPSVISRKSDADRFVMGILRACADVVLVGAGTVRAEPDHRWTPEFVYPRRRTPRHACRLASNWRLSRALRCSPPAEIDLVICLLRRVHSSGTKEAEPEGHGRDLPLREHRQHCDEHDREAQQQSLAARERELDRVAGESPPSSCEHLLSVAAAAVRAAVAAGLEHPDGTLDRVAEGDTCRPLPS
jgi:hypothetical protein